MGPVGEQIMEKGYEEYLKMDKAEVGKPSEMYDKGWCKFTGRSIVYPHPHRHYTFEEFFDKMVESQEFADRFFRKELLNRN